MKNFNLLRILSCMFLIINSLFIVNAQTFSLNDVYFVNSSVVFAVGNSGVIYKSSDEGKSWKQIQSPVLENLNGIKFKNSIGIIAGSKGTILKSTDKGETWLKGVSNTTLDLSCIAIITDTKIIVGGADATILQSNNTGDTWTKANTISKTYDISGLSFMDENKGVITAGGTIFQTSDGGSTWKETKPSSINGHHTAWSNLRCCDYKSDLIAVGENFNTKVSISPAGIEYYDAIWYKEGTNGFVEKKGTFRKCYDKTCTGTYMIQDIKIIDENTFIAVGENGLIIKIKDLGKTWNYINTGITKNLYAVNFVGNIGISVGNGVILRSNDNGDSWELINSISEATAPENPTKVSQSNFTNDFSYQIYPNPTMGLLTIKCETPNSILTIYSFDGKSLINKFLSEKVNKIDLNNLANGVYIIRIENSKGLFTKKLLKQ